MTLANVGDSQKGHVLHLNRLFEIEPFFVFYCRVKFYLERCCFR